jgi:hypothetical protein
MNARAWEGMRQLSTLAENFIAKISITNTRKQRVPVITDLKFD